MKEETPMNVLVKVDGEPVTCRLEIQNEHVSYILFDRPLRCGQDTNIQITYTFDDEYQRQRPSD